MTDYTHIEARHDSVNIRLEQWARWVQVRPQVWKMQPMFRSYRAPRQYAYETADIKVALNTLECHEIERIVSHLPDKHRSALRWYYVYPFISDSRIRRELGETRAGLAELLHKGRCMVVNRLREKVQEAVNGD